MAASRLIAAVSSRSCRWSTKSGAKVAPPQQSRRRRRRAAATRARDLQQLDAAPIKHKRTDGRTDGKRAASLVTSRPPVSVRVCVSLVGLCLLLACLSIWRRARNDRDHSALCAALCSRRPLEQPQSGRRLGDYCLVFFSGRPLGRREERENSIGGEAPRSRATRRLFQWPPRREPLVFVFVFGCGCGGGRFAMAATKLNVWREQPTSARRRDTKHRESIIDPFGRSVARVRA